jgi:peroxin-6
VSPGKAFPRKDTPIEIRVLDIVPLGLETIFVSLETEELKKLDEVHARFGGGFGGDNREKTLSPRRAGNPGKNRHQDFRLQESAWRKAVRDALKAPQLVHAGDLLPLPLPAHPITHVAAPPAKITACEPVSQGLLLPRTRVVIVHSHKHVKVAKPTTAPITNGIPEEDEDTSNEMFYSAAEDRSSQAPSPPEESTDDLASETSATDQDDLSDDSEDAFSLMSPTLPPSSGILSSYQSGTPRPGVYSTHGIATPGSMVSGFSSSTVRAGSSGAKLFKTQGLLQRLPDDLLYPKPSSEEDEEARVFVDTSILVKIGCFSGDWVRLEAASEPSSHSFAPWKLGSFDDEQEEHHEWRAAKIYGLPESVSKKHVRMPSHKMMSRKSSFLDMMGSQSYASAFASPLLLENLGGPSHIRIQPLAAIAAAYPEKLKITSSSLPPYAKEVTLMKLATPLSLDRSLQPSLFTGLREFFEQKRRIVKSGDLVAIAIDESLGRSVFQVSDEASIEEVLSKPKNGPDWSHVNQSPGSRKVAWFKVDNVIASAAEEDEEKELWGGVACVDASNAKMVQAGSEQGHAPSTLDSTWQYYLDVKRTPAGSDSGIARIVGTTELPEPQISPLRRRLRELISAATSPQAIHLALPPSAILLTSTQRQIGKAFNAERACEDLGLHTFVIDAYDIVTENGAGGGDVKTEGVLRARAERAMTCGAEFTVILIKHIEALGS